MEPDVSGALTDRTTYAPVLIRGAARLVDGIILFAPFMLVALGVAAFDVDTRNPAIGLVFIAIAGAYEVVLTARTGQTLGKRLLRIRVARLDGSAPGWVPSLIRFAVPTAVSYLVDRLIPGGLGALGMLAVFLFALLDPQKQGLHDKSAGTIVVTIGDPGTT